MKIYVNKIPIEAKECLFARKEVDAVLRDIETGKPTPMYTYFCNVDNKFCNLHRNGQCNKLRVPFDL